ncbi:MAG TPA: hypothetical protein PLJ08_15720, partial [Cyclobacteriaceae bacterium]|nr:hypothetical protein [Cyclobacteriaceae bacterium]
MKSYAFPFQGVTFTLVYELSVNFSIFAANFGADKSDQNSLKPSAYVYSNLTMVDLFDKLKMEAGPLAKYSHLPDDYF